MENRFKEDNFEGRKLRTETVTKIQMESNESKVGSDSKGQEYSLIEKDTGHTIDAI